MYVPPFYDCSCRVTLYGDTIGSTLNKLSSQSSSVVMAQWPSYGSNINTTDYSGMSEGIVQYFFKHTVTLKQDSLTSKYDHVFAFVKWRKLHENVRYYGISAAVCINDF